MVRIAARGALTALPDPSNLQSWWTRVGPACHASLPWSAPGRADLERDLMRRVQALFTYYSSAVCFILDRSLCSRGPRFPSSRILRYSKTEHSELRLRQ